MKNVGQRYLVTLIEFIIISQSNLFVENLFSSTKTSSLSIFDILLTYKVINFFKHESSNFPFKIITFSSETNLYNSI